MESYLLNLFAVFAIYALVAYSMNLVTGYGGIMQFCAASFYGIGAYAYTLLRINESTSMPERILFSFDVSFPAAVMGAAVAGGAAALVIGTICLRFRGDSLIFVTLAFQIIVYSFLYNSTGIDGGAYGIAAIPRPTIGVWRVESLVDYSLLVLLVDALLLPVLFILYRSPYGMSLKALRDNERAAESLGISAFRQHLAAFVIAGSFAAVAGALFASYMTYIDPTSFDLRESIFLLAILLLGGSGNIGGPIAGVLVMILLPEIVRFLGFPASSAPNIREVVYGAALVVLMFWRNKGLAGEYSV